MKRCAIVLLVSIMLLSLTACGEKPSVLSATGKYNGQDVTMSYMVTDVVYPEDMRTLCSVNGYAIFYDYQWYEEYEKTGVQPYPEGTWNALDRQGNILFDEPYKELTSFFIDGKAAAKRQDDTCVLITPKGKETAITAQELLAYQFEDTNYGCSNIYPKNFDECSCLSDELAIYVEFREDSTSLAGLIDKNGSIIVPAFIPIYYNTFVEQLHLDEDIAFVEDRETGNIGIITITRS